MNIRIADDREHEDENKLVSNARKERHRRHIGRHHSNGVDIANDVAAACRCEQKRWRAVISSRNDSDDVYDGNRQDNGFV